MPDGLIALEKFRQTLVKVLEAPEGVSLVSRELGRAMGRISNKKLTAKQRKAKSMAMLDARWAKVRAAKAAAAAELVA